MLKVTRLTTATIGLLSLTTMFNIWFNTTNAVAPMGIEAGDLITRATARADIAGLFGGIGILALWAAWRTDRAALTGAILLSGMAFAGRWISVLIDGVGAGVWPPIIVEAIVIGLFALAYRTWSR
jgi:hypothetical protein